jgi:hypothetical protein
MDKSDKDAARENFVKKAIDAAKDNNASCDVTFAEAMFNAGFKAPAEPNTVNKSDTTISSSKYNYTEQVGDSLISYGFDSLAEMLTHVNYLKKLSR